MVVITRWSYKQGCHKAGLHCSCVPTNHSRSHGLLIWHFPELRQKSETKFALIQGNSKYFSYWFMQMFYLLKVTSLACRQLTYILETHYPNGSLFWFLTKYKRINAHLICFPGSAKKEVCWYLALQRMRKDYRWRSMGCQVQHAMFIVHVYPPHISYFINAFRIPCFKIPLYTAFKTKCISVFAVIFSSELIWSSSRAVS